MSNYYSNTPGTRILPLVYSNGQYVTEDDLFSSDTLYEVISGPHAGRRGARRELEALCGLCVEADWFSAVSCETGAILRRVNNSFSPTSDFVL